MDATLRTGGALNLSDISRSVPNVRHGPAIYETQLPNGATSLDGLM